MSLSFCDSCKYFADHVASEIIEKNTVCHLMGVYDVLSQNSNLTRRVRNDALEQLALLPLRCRVTPMGVSDMLPFLETYVAIEVLVTVRCMGKRRRVAPCPL
jgi:hypothetical protein